MIRKNGENRGTQLCDSWGCYACQKPEFTLNLNSVSPYDLRMNMYNVGSFFDCNGLHLESEYFYKTYTGSVFSATEGFLRLSLTILKRLN